MAYYNMKERTWHKALVYPIINASTWSKNVSVHKTHMLCMKGA